MFTIPGHKEDMKTFYNKQKLKEFMTTKLALQKILKGLLHTEENRVRQEDTKKNKTFWSCRLVNKD
jgi:hypothetical protein